MPLIVAGCVLTLLDDDLKSEIGILASHVFVCNGSTLYQYPKLQLRAIWRLIRAGVRDLVGLPIFDSFLTLIVLFSSFST